MKKIKSLTDSKGFTLIELLVVITIIGILATGATAVYSGAQKSARDAIRTSDVAALSSSVDLYMVDNEEVLPTAITDLSNYLKSEPKPPKSDSTSTSKAYIIAKADDGTSYIAAACGMADPLVDDGETHFVGAGNVATDSAVDGAITCGVDGTAVSAVANTAFGTDVDTAGVIGYKLGST